MANKEKNLYIIIDRDIESPEEWRNKRKELIGLRAYLPFNLFQPRKKNKPALYDERSIQVGNELCVLDSTNGGRTVYLIEEVDKHAFNYRYYLKLRLKLEGEQNEETISKIDDCFYDV